MHMKNKATHQVRRSTKPAVIQPLKEPGVDKTGTYGGNEPICLTVFDHLKDKHYAGCDITAQEWLNIKEHCAERGISISAFLKEAIMPRSLGWFVQESRKAHN